VSGGNDVPSSLGRLYWKFFTSMMLDSYSLWSYRIER